MVAVGHMLNGVLAVLAMGAVVLPGTWYALRQDEFEGVSARTTGLSWGDVDADSAELLVTTEFETHRTGARLIALRLDGLVDDRRLGSVDEAARLRIGEDKIGLHQARLPFDSVDLLRALFLSAAEGRPTRFEVRGEAVFSLGLDRTTVPFAVDATWMFQPLRAVPPPAGCEGAAVPCVASIDARWASRGYLAMVADLVVHNPTDDAVTIQPTSATLLLGNVSAAQLEPGVAVEVPAGGESLVSVVLPVDAARLLEWWPLHTERCERSDIGLAIEVNSDGQPLAWAFTGPPLETRLACGDNSWYG